MRISIGSDHAGYELKEKVKKHLLECSHEVQDEGTHDSESTDYPDYAARVARAVRSGRAERGILVCGTGIGMSIAANKHPGIRAALAGSVEEARLSRLHNDANVLTMGGRTMKSEKLALEVVGEWLRTPFEGGRHQRRVEKISQSECKEVDE